MFVGRCLLVGVVLWSISFLFIFTSDALKASLGITKNSDVITENVGLSSTLPVTDVAKKGEGFLKKPRSRFVRVTRRVLSGMSSGISKVFEWKPMQIPAVIALAISLFILREKWIAYNNEKKKAASDKNNCGTAVGSPRVGGAVLRLESVCTQTEPDVTILQGEQGQVGGIGALNSKVASLETELSSVKTKLENFEKGFALGRVRVRGQQEQNSAEEGVNVNTERPQVNSNGVDHRTVDAILECLTIICHNEVAMHY